MKIHHIAITVNNLDESVKFYTEMLGFEIAKKFERKDMGAFATFIKLKDFQIELWQFKDMINNTDDLNNIKIRGIRHIAFEVTDLKEAVSSFIQKGLIFTEIKMGASGHNYSFTKDPNGVVVEFYES